MLEPAVGLVAEQEAMPVFVVIFFVVLPFVVIFFVAKFFVVQFFVFKFFEFKSLIKTCPSS